MIIPVLGGHALYNGWVKAPKKNTDNVTRRPRAPMTAEARSAYARLFAAAVLRYRGYNIIWEIWNEPDLARFWPVRPDAKAYSTLATEVCLRVRSVVPEAVLVGPALGRIPDPQDNVTPEYLSTVLLSKAAQCFDAISVHPYRHGAEEPEAVFRDYEQIHLMMAAHKNYKPVVNTEWGYTTSQVSASQQAAYALRMRLIDMMWNVPLSIWYEWRDSRVESSDPEGFFGLTRINGEDKPAMTAIAALMPQIHDATFVRQVHTRNPKDVLLLLKSKAGKHMIVGWSLRVKGEEPTARVAALRSFNRALGLLSPIPQILVTGPIARLAQVDIEEVTIQ